MTERPFRVGYTHDFLNAEGNLVYKSIGREHLGKSSISIKSAFLEHHEPTLTPSLLDGYDAIVSLTPRIERESLAGVKDLLAISRFGVGYDSVDVQACTDNGTALCITRGAVDHSVGQAIVAWMLQLGHRSREKDRLVRENKWHERGGYMGGGLRGRTLGIVGFGGIGSTLANFVRIFGMDRILVFDPYLDTRQAASSEVISTGLERLLKESDYVAICCPLNDETRNLIAERELGLMKSTAFLINTARGGIVNEAALCRALEAGRLAGAGIDVFDQEPPPATSPLMRMNNVILAPHCIAWTDDLFFDIGRVSAEQVMAFARGEIPNGVVNTEVLENPSFLRKLRRRSEAAGALQEVR